MSAIRYCGALRIRVTYREPMQHANGTFDAGNGTYACVITPMTEKADRVTVYVGAPACLSHAVDSSEAFDDAASAALVFATDDGWPVDQYAEFNAFDDYADSSGTYVISRKVPS